jgi:hypothetical protein
MANYMPQEKLSFAGFKGVEFFVTNETEETRGRKLAIHDYPNSSKRFVQDLGSLPSTFGVDAVVFGQEFLEKAIVLKSVLDEEGVGELVLPHLGSLDVVALPYSVDYSHKSIGVIRFKLKFTLSNADEIPSQARASAQDVIQKAKEAREENQNKLASEYKKPIGDISFIKATTDFTSGVADTVENFTSEIVVANDQIQGIVRDVQSDVSSIVVNPQILAEKLIYGNVQLANGLFATFSSLLTDPDLLTNPNRPSVKKLLDNITFGAAFNDLGTSSTSSDLALWPSDTGDRVDRNNNRRAIVESVRYNTLLLAFEVAASYGYNTTEDIIAVTSDLEEAYTTVMLNDDEGSVIVSDNDLKILMDEVKSSAFDVLELKLQQAYSTTNYDVGGVQSIFGLTYRLYAENFTEPSELEEFAENMVLLNSDQVPTEFSGSSSVFEAQ